MGQAPVTLSSQVYVAAFAVSAYASTYYRAGSKPFNPVLGETYECVRPDRGFRFISEQVQSQPASLGGARVAVSHCSTLTFPVTLLPSPGWNPNCLLCVS